jgi:hypothetical protein
MVMQMSSNSTMFFSHTALLFELQYKHSGFGSLVVSMLASSTRVRGFKLGRSRWIFSGEKSFGKELKPFAPYRRFAAR